MALGGGGAPGGKEPGSLSDGVEESPHRTHRLPGTHLQTRNGLLALSASLCHHLLVSAIDLETSLDVALCQDTFYSKWSWLFLLLFIPSLISVFNTDFLWHVTWITLPLRL